MFSESRANRGFNFPSFFAFTELSRWTQFVQKKKVTSQQGAKLYAAFYFGVGYNNQNSFYSNYTESN